MPGLCGFIISPKLRSSSASIVNLMRQSLVHRSHHQCDRFFIDESVAATRVHLGIIQPDNQPFTRDNTYIWFDGELYADTCDSLGKDPGLLLLNYLKNNLISFLHDIDGIFSAVIYDKKKRSLILISDRYGLRHLYYCSWKDGLAWSSEIKAFKYLPDISLDVNPERISDFIGKGYLCDDNTWFDNVKLLQPASVLRFDTATSSLEQKKYWGWEEIKPIRIGADIDSISDTLGGAFTKAVRKRCLKGERIGMGLSGGLDSRAIFAALPSFIEPVNLYTFGIEGCRDISIARKVASLRPSRHVIFPINSDNWLNNRLEGVWITDGQFNMLHMHGIEQIDALRDLFDISLNGFLGDALLGGSYGASPDGELALFTNRGRRFIALGLSLDNIVVHTRTPFFDNELMEITMSIPWKYRRNSFIYNRMLLRTFPEFFESIPWQKTGLPISAAGPFWETVRFTKKCYYYLQRRLGFLPGNIDYTDYPTWIRQDPGCRFFINLLTSKDTILYTYINPRKIVAVLHGHFSGVNNAELLGRYATIEIWLRRFLREEIMDFR